MIEFPDQIQARRRLVPAADGGLLEVRRWPHGPPPGLQVQLSRHGLPLAAPPEPLHRRARRRRGDQDAVQAGRAVDTGEQQGALEVRGALRSPRVGRARGGRGGLAQGEV